MYPLKFRNHGMRLQVLFDMILDEAKFHCSFSNLTTDAIIKNMLEVLIHSNVIDIHDLKFMIDSELEYILLHNVKTRALAKKLWFQIDQFKITKNLQDVATDYVSIEVKKLYLSMPLVNNVPFDILNHEAKSKILEIQKLKGTYYIF